MCRLAPNSPHTRAKDIEDYIVIVNYIVEKNKMVKIVRETASLRASQQASKQTFISWLEPKDDFERYFEKP